MFLCKLYEFDCKNVFILWCSLYKKTRIISRFDNWVLKIKLSCVSVMKTSKTNAFSGISNSKRHPLKMKTKSSKHMCKYFFFIWYHMVKYKILSQVKVVWNELTCLVLYLLMVLWIILFFYSIKTNDLCLGCHVAQVGYVCFVSTLVYRFYA